MRHAKNGLAAKFTIFIFTLPFGAVSPGERDVTCTGGIGTGDEIRGEPAIRR
jgi:hypothetical protein